MAFTATTNTISGVIVAAITNLTERYCMANITKYPHPNVQPVPEEAEAFLKGKRSVRKQPVQSVLEDKTPSHKPLAPKGDSAESLSGSVGWIRLVLGKRGDIDSMTFFPTIKFVGHRSEKQKNEAWEILETAREIPIKSPRASQNAMVLTLTTNNPDKKFHIKTMLSMAFIAASNGQIRSVGVDGGDTVMITKHWQSTDKVWHDASMTTRSGDKVGELKRQYEDSIKLPIVPTLMAKVEIYARTKAGLDIEDDKKFVAWALNEAQKQPLNTIDDKKCFVRVMNERIMKPYNIRIHDGLGRGLLTVSNGRGHSLQIEGYDRSKKRGSTRSLSTRKLNVIAISNAYRSAPSDLNSAISV